MLWNLIEGKIVYKKSGPIKMDNFTTIKNMGALSIEEVNDVEDFRDLRESWNTLLQKSSDNNIFLTWEWLCNWWRHYGNDKKLRILIIKESNKIIGIAPFMQVKYRQGFFSVDVIENLCSVNCDYSGIILTERKDEAVAILLAYVKKIVTTNNIILAVSHVPENSDFLRILREQYPSFSKSLLMYEKIVASCPYIMLPATWEEYFNTLSKRIRKSLRRAMRSLQTHKVEFKKYDSGKDLDEQLQVLFDLHQKRWKLKNFRSKFAELEAREFYIDVSKACSKNDWLDLSILEIDGKPVSARWGFNYNNTIYCMTPAFDPEYSDYGVGNLHRMKLIEDAISNGLGKFDFLKGDEDYKFEWASCKTDNIRITMVKRGLRGRYRAKLLQMLIIYGYARERSFRENIRLLYRKLRPQRDSTNAEEHPSL